MTKQKPWAKRAERSTQGTFVASDEPRNVPLNVRIPERVNGLLKKIQNGGGSRSDAAIAAALEQEKSS